MHHLAKITALGVVLGLVVLALVGVNLKHNFASPQGETRLVSGVNQAASGLGVNGILFDTTRTEVTINDQSAMVEALAPGMVVALSTNMEPSGKIGWAREVVVDSLLTGPVIANEIAEDDRGQLDE